MPQDDVHPHEVGDEPAGSQPAQPNHTPEGEEGWPTDGETHRPPLTPGEIPASWLPQPDQDAQDRPESSAQDQDWPEVDENPERPSADDRGNFGPDPASKAQASHQQTTGQWPSFPQNAPGQPWNGQSPTPGSGAPAQFPPAQFPPSQHPGPFHDAGAQNPPGQPATGQYPAYPPEPGSPYPPGQYPGYPQGPDAPGQPPTGQPPVSQYPVSQPPVSQYPAGQPPAGQAPAGQYPTHPQGSGVPGQNYPPGSGAPGQYPPYPTGPNPSGAWFQGQYPPGQYPPGQQPGQYPPGQQFPPGGGPGWNLPERKRKTLEELKASALHTRERLRLFIIMVLGLLLVSQLPLPFRLAGIALGLAGGFVGIRVLIGLAEMRRAGMGARGVVFTLFGLGLTGMLLLVLVSQAVYYPVVSDLEKCQARANTEAADQACVDETNDRFNNILDDLNQRARTN